VVHKVCLVVSVLECLYQGPIWQVSGDNYSIVRLLSWSGSECSILSRIPVLLCLVVAHHYWSEAVFLNSYLVMVSTCPDLSPISMLAVE
jgi:hypothetical protein